MVQSAYQATQQNQNRYYGKYRGFVHDNADPEQRGRLKVRIPSLLGDQETGWALPCSPFGGLADQGLFMIPEIDAQIWVEFEEGNLHKPIWVGVFWQQQSDTPIEAALEEPTTRVIKTPSGHVLQFDDKSGEEQFRLAHPAGTELTVNSAGTVNYTDAGGSSITLDAEANSIVIEDSNGNTITLDTSGTVVEDVNGNKIEMAAAGITVSATKIVLSGQQVEVGGEGGDPLINGQKFLSLFNSHTHVCAAPGSPTAPPVPPLTPAMLTLKAKAS